MIDLDTYAYAYPPELVATEPVEPRDSARLFVYDTKTNTVTFDIFSNIARYVAPALLVLNETKVVPARLTAMTGDGPIEVFILFDQGIIDGAYVHALVNRFVAVGSVLTVAPECQFTVVDNRAKHMVLKPSFDIGTLEAVLSQYGATPIPPYIKTVSPESVLRQRYQTVFAVKPGSVAAPTASLHFTEATFASLQDAGSSWTTVDLRVGLGTFAPVLPEHIAAEKLHREHFAVSQAAAVAIREARAQGRAVCAVGTTVVRTLESASLSIHAGLPVQGDTDMFIMPPYAFSIPDMLVTNFHVPRSSLLCLVDAFLQHKGASRSIMSLYEEAIAARFRLFSFGDAMLIL